MADTRACVELAIPPKLCLAVAQGTTFSCFDSLGHVIDMDGARQLLEVRTALEKSIGEALEPLRPPQRTTAARYLDLAASAALDELDGQPSAKGMRAILWWISDTIAAGRIELWAGSAADLAISRLQRWTQDTFDLLNPTAADRMDDSAIKNARKIGDVLRRAGYFTS